MKGSEARVLFPAAVQAYGENRSVRIVAEAVGLSPYHVAQAVHAAIASGELPKHKVRSPRIKKERQTAPWIADAIRLTRDGRTMEEVGRAMGRSRERVRQVLKRAGVKRNVQAARFARLPGGDLTVFRYLTGEPVQAIADSVGLNESTLRWHMTQLGHSRPRVGIVRWSVASILAHTTRTQCGCLLWNGSVTCLGYVRVNGTKSLHRIVYDKFYGELPPGMSVDHKCHRRSCVNPEHIQALTPSENSSKKVRGAFDAECALRRSLGLPVSPNAKVSRQARGAA